MSLAVRLFPTYPARPTFGVNNAVQNAGDYILEKKIKKSFCNISLCKQNNNVKTQSDLLSLKKSNYLYNKCLSRTFNKSNLNVNLFTKLYLQDVKVISDAAGISPAPIDIPTISNYVPPYVSYNIDPCGLLFGNTICGVNNYQNFVVYNPPYLSKDDNNTSDICKTFNVEEL